MSHHGVFPSTSWVVGWRIKDYYFLELIDGVI
jgi:hypothetical protein